MFDLNEMLKQSDGHHIVTVHSDDKEVRAAVVAGMEYKGYRQYSMSNQQDGSVQYGFVTQAHYEVLHEQHLDSCRNSLGSSLGLLQDKGVLGRAWDRIRGRSLRTPEERKRDFLVHGPTGQPPAVDELTLARQRAADDDSDLATLAVLVAVSSIDDQPASVELPDHDVFSGDRHPPRRDIESVTEVEAAPEVRTIRELNITTSRSEVDTFMQPASVSSRISHESYHHVTQQSAVNSADDSSRRSPSYDPDPPSSNYSDSSSNDSSPSD